MKANYRSWVQLLIAVIATLFGLTLVGIVGMDFAKDFDKSKCSAPSSLLFSSKLSVCRRGHLPALTGYPSCTEGCDAAKIGPSGPCRINRRFAASLVSARLRIGKVEGGATGGSKR